MSRTRTQVWTKRVAMAGSLRRVGEREGVGDAGQLEHSLHLAPAREQAQVEALLAGAVVDLEDEAHARRIEKRDLAEVDDELLGGRGEEPVERLLGLEARAHVELARQHEAGPAALAVGRQ